MIKVEILCADFMKLLRCLKSLPKFEKKQIQSKKNVSALQQVKCFVQCADLRMASSTIRESQRQYS